MKSLTIIFCFILSQINVGTAANDRNLSEKSYERSRKILLSGTQALGGMKKIKSVQDFDITYNELASSRGQNVSPQALEFFVEGGEARLLYNAKNGFSRHERNLQRRGRLFNPIMVYKGDKGFFYWPETNELHTSINVNLIKGLFNFRFTNPTRLMPHLILQTALKSATTLRSLGETQYKGSIHDVITFSESSGKLTTLYFNRETNLLAKTEELMDDLLAGDSVGEISYTKYRNVDGLQFPGEIVFTVAGTVTQRMQILNVELNTKPDEQQFEPPTGVEPSKYPRPFAPQQIAEGVYFVPLFNSIGISYNSMFVVFDNHVMVFDAPLSDLLSQFYIGLIKQVAPGKPIKYVVPTHHHSDHIGGIKRFVAEGATVVTTDGNKQLVVQIVTAQRTLRPTRPGLKEKLTFEIIDDEKVFEDDSHKVEVYNVGPNPHADDILVAYLPKEKILYVTDMLWVHLADQYPEPRATLRAFNDRIEKLGLEIETIAPGHGKVGTIEDLRKALGINDGDRNTQKI